MTESELRELYGYLVPAVKSIYASSPKGGKAEYKELNDIATETDRYMEKEIVGLIRRKYPDHSFIGEEFGASGGASRYEWLIDPIDGTVNFASGIPMFGTSVALRDNGETVFGVIFDWPGDKVYHAIKGCGAFCGDERLRVSGRSSLRDSVVSVCLAPSYGEALCEGVLEIIKRLQPLVRGIRIVVCTVYELMWVASGLTEAFVNIRPSVGVGSCAGRLIVSEAGGKVTNAKGETRANVDTLFVSNSKVHREILDAIS